MGIFSGLFKSRNKLQGRTSGSNYAFSLEIAGLPLHLYKYIGSGGKAMFHHIPDDIKALVSNLEASTAAVCIRCP